MSGDQSAPNFRSSPNFDVAVETKTQSRSKAPLGSTQPLVVMNGRGGEGEGREERGEVVRPGIRQERSRLERVFINGVFDTACKMPSAMSNQVHNLMRRRNGS